MISRGNESSALKHESMNNASLAQTVPPVARPTMTVGDCHDQDGAFRNAIHDAVRKSPQQEPSRIVAASSPGEGKPSDLGRRRGGVFSETSISQSCQSVYRHTSVVRPRRIVGRTCRAVARTPVLTEFYLLTFDF